MRNANATTLAQWKLTYLSNGQKTKHKCSIWLFYTQPKLHPEVVALWIQLVLAVVLNSGSEALNRKMGRFQSRVLYFLLSYSCISSVVTAQKAYAHSLWLWKTLLCCRAQNRKRVMVWSPEEPIQGKLSWPCGIHIQLKLTVKWEHTVNHRSWEISSSALCCFNVESLHTSCWAMNNTACKLMPLCNSLHVVFLLLEAALYPSLFSFCEQSGILEWMTYFQIYTPWDIVTVPKE